MLNKDRFKRVLLSGLIIGTIPMCIGCENKQKESNVNTTTTKVVEKEEVNHFKVVYEGVDVTPGKLFNANEIKKEAKKKTIDSCAGFGKDNVYTYDNVEITANVNSDENKEIIYSVYYINDTVSNNDGLKVGLSVSEMKNILGEEDDEFNGVYTYNGEGSYIKIQTKDDVITSIEYLMNAN